MIKNIYTPWKLSPCRSAQEADASDMWAVCSTSPKSATDLFSRSSFVEKQITGVFPQSGRLPKFLRWTLPPFITNQCHTQKWPAVKVGRYLLRILWWPGVSSKSDSSLCNSSPSRSATRFLSLSMGHSVRTLLGSGPILLDWSAPAVWCSQKGVVPPSK